MSREIILPGTIKESNRAVASFLAMALLPLSGFATDIYLPSLPVMATGMHISSIQVQFTLTLFLISYGLTQLFVGSLLDSFGRYRIGMGCLIIFAASCIVIAVTKNIYVIYAMRILHGITIGTVIVGKRAYFIDLFTGDKLKHYLSLFSIIWSTGPIVAPFIGGYLQAKFGWESNFYFLAFFAIVLVILDYFFSGETLPQRFPFKMKSIARVYLKMLSTSDFTLGLVMCGLAYCMVIMFNLTGPFIIEHKMGLSPVVAGYCSLLLGLAWMGGGLVGKATITKPFFKRMVVNISFQVLFVLAMLLAAKYITDLFPLLLFAFIIQFASGYTFNNFFTYCLSRFPKNGGIASGLSGGTSYIVISICSTVILFFNPEQGVINLSISYAILIAISIIVMIVLGLGKKKFG